ncbi:MAG: zinc ribbon domain-containing protein [Oscillospiraceae bacterium]|nr:zinc ribbon domain-containing protein [Oscillospiraceae bacterium]
MNGKFCQSDGAPMEHYEYGTEADGSKSTDYCKFCYDNGAFTNPDCTLEEMIEKTAAAMVRDFGFSPEEAKKQCGAALPTLKRWAKS